MRSVAAGSVAVMAQPDCVGALIRDAGHRVYVHRRSADRRLFPGVWDVVGGHVDPGESPERALAREVEEETGWTLRRVDGVLARWEWTPDDGRPRLEWDYLVEVDGDLDTPRLEAGKHDAFAWVGPGELDLLMAGRTDGDRRLRDIVAKAARTRLTARLRLEPVGPDHVSDLLRLHTQPELAQWYGETLTPQRAVHVARTKSEAWETVGVSKWMAYDRETGELVGRGGVDRLAVDGEVAAQIGALLPGDGWLTDRLEVGWAVSADKQRRGYATEIGRAGLDHAFGELGAKQVIAYTEVHNEASRAVMKRLGMTYAGEIAAPGLVPAGSTVQQFAPFAVYVVSR